MRAFPAVVCETLLVAVLGTSLALVANGLSPHGLRLDRDYFPGIQPPAAPVAAVGDKPEGPAAAVQRRLERQKLRLADRTEVAAWFRDPQYQQGLTVFVDARDDAAYQAGHIPGAWQFNHYRAEHHLAAV